MVNGQRVLTTDILSWWEWRGWQIRWMVMMKWHRWKRRRWRAKSSWRIHQRSWMKYCHDVFHVKGEKKTCFKRYNHRQEMSRRRKMITSTRGSLHVTDDKTQGIIWRSTHKEETGWMSRAGREKNRLNGNLKETSLIKHMITVLTDEKPIWQKWLYSMKFETSMYEIWSMTVYYNNMKDHRSHRRKWDRKEGPSTRKGRWTQMTG